MLWRDFIFKNLPFNWFNNNCLNKINKKWWYWFLWETNSNLLCNFVKLVILIWNHNLNVKCSFNTKIDNFFKWMWKEFLNLISSITQAWHSDKSTGTHSSSLYTNFLKDNRKLLDKSALELFVGTAKMIGFGKVLISRITHFKNINLLRGFHKKKSYIIEWIGWKNF